MKLLSFLAWSSSISLGASKDFDWAAIEPTAEIKYHTCYDGFRCARLTVPLDWQDHENNETVALAIISLPARVPADDPSFGGTIITNPGGPGGSGVRDLVVDGRTLQTLVDGSKHYEVLSFDPRGVAFSTPSANCFSDEFARAMIHERFRAMPDLDNGPAILARHFAGAEAHGRLCAQNTAARGSVEGAGAQIQSGQFFSTAVVARDMLEIVTRVHQYGLGSERWTTSNHSPSGLQLPIGNTQTTNADAPRLQYLGFSYGTILGNTFASMYPGRVKRMVLDGVADPDDYSNGLWRRNMDDVETVAESFYARCFEVGKDCALYDSTDRGGGDIKERVDRMIDNLSHQPAAAVIDGLPTMITATDVRTIIQVPLHEPLDYLPRLAQELAWALQGNFTLMAQRLGLPSASQTCPSYPETGRFAYSWGMEAATTYICNDGPATADRNMTFYTDYIGYLRRQSPLLGPLWAQLVVRCEGWQIRPRWRFDGPFRTPASDARLADDRPAAPLLFLGARSDPATPLVNACEATKRSPVVIQESEGHCAVYSAPSACTKKIVGKYFELGIVPENGTVCVVDCKPWESCSSSFALANAHHFGLRRRLEVPV